MINLENKELMLNKRCDTQFRAEEILKLKQQENLINQKMQEYAKKL